MGSCFSKIFCSTFLFLGSLREKSTTLSTTSMVELEERKESVCAGTRAGTRFQEPMVQPVCAGKDSAQSVYSSKCKYTLDSHQRNNLLIQSRSNHDSKLKSISKRKSCMHITGSGHPVLQTGRSLPHSLRVRAHQLLVLQRMSVEDTYFPKTEAQVYTGTQYFLPDCRQNRQSEPHRVSCNCMALLLTFRHKNVCIKNGIFQSGAHWLSSGREGWDLASTHASRAAFSNLPSYFSMGSSKSLYSTTPGAFLICTQKMEVNVSTACSLQEQCCRPAPQCC